MTVGQALYRFDPADDRLLAGFATDIFVGRVTAQTGTKGANTSAPGQTLPQTQFAVQVLQLVKGTARGTVTVNQVGGVDALTNRLFLFEGDPLLTTGTTALFVTAYVPELGWHQIVASGYGDIRIGGPLEQARLVERFAKAAGVALPAAADATATPTRKPSPTQEPSAVPPTETPTSEPTATERPVLTDTPTPEPTATERPVLTDTPTSEPTATETATPTETPVPTDTPTPESTAAETPSEA